MYRLRELRKQKGETQLDIAKALHVTPQAVSKWENGLSEIGDDYCRKLSRHFNVSIDYLLGNAATMPHRIPVYASIQAGIPLNSIKDIVDWEDIPTTWQGDYFALKVKGRSMEPRIVDGDVVICKAQSVVDSGSIAVVLVNGNEATLKQYKRSDKGITLIGFNADVYPPHFYTAEEVNELPIRIVGLAVEVRHKL